MIHALFAQLQVALHVLSEYARGRATAQARAVTFLEYALLAVVAVILGLVFREQLGNAFNSMFGKVNSGIGMK